MELLTKKFTFALTPSEYTKLHEMAPRAGKKPGGFLRELLQQAVRSGGGEGWSSPEHLSVSSPMGLMIDRVARGLNIPVEEAVEGILLSGLPEWLERTRRREDELLSELQTKGSTRDATGATRPKVPRLGRVATEGDR